MSEEAAAPAEALAAGQDAGFRQLADTAPMLIWRCDTTRAYDFFNRTWLEFAGRRLEEELGSGWLDRVHPEDRERRTAAFLGAFERRERFSAEYRLLRHDGAWRWIADTGQPAAIDGRFTGYVGTCIDITEMRQALEARQRAIEEREALLNELHHRVKNNAQATTSFLGLQASRATDPGIAAALRGAATRVLLATLVQDRMFRVLDDAPVELGTELAATARTALEILGRHDLTLAVDIGAPVRLPVAQAQPLALIVNELVVNAARHAFPDGRRGTIRLAVRPIEHGQAEVVVADDGVGLPETHARNTPTGCLGLHLMPRLARQARATLIFEAGGGTRAVLRFAGGSGKTRSGGNT